MKWWRLAVGGALLAWVLGVAYGRAHKRGRELGYVVLLLGAALVMFISSAFLPRPPVTVALASALLIGSIAALAGAIAVVLWKGFRD